MDWVAEYDGGCGEEGSGDGAEVGRQSFRESFYNSGTDWKALYAVDDYGMPLSHSEAPSSVDCGAEFRERSESRSDLCCDSNSNRGLCSDDGRSSGSVGMLLDVAVPERARLLKSSASSPSPSSSKLVQSDLCRFLGIKKAKAAVEKAASGKRLRQQDIGVLFGIPAAVKNPTPGRAEFLSKFKRAGSSTELKTDERKGRGFPEPQKPRSCPFYKKIPGTQFTVDAFKYGEVAGCAAYFLSHFHYDHYGGLTKGWCHGPIYCTPITARLVVLCLYVEPRWICPLQIGVTHVVEGVEVRMLEANHCPGAALILFRFKNGHSILHTGDFRACKGMQNYPELLNGSISTVYLDTTYCNQRYRFPLQEEVIKFVIRQVSNALKRNAKTLVVVGSYSIGKERVYVSIAEALNVQVFADRHRRRVLTSLEWPELAKRLSTDAESTFLHVLPLSNLNPQKLKAYLQSHHPKYSAVLAFRPTGWTYTEKVGDNLEMIKPQISGPVTIYGVPYSEHSSFTELQEFVQFIRPAKIIPTVNIWKASDRERMQVIFSNWLA